MDDNEKVVQSYLNFKSLFPKNPLQGVADHLPPVSMKIEKLCQMVAREVSLVDSESDKKMAFKPLLKELIINGTEADSNALIFKRVWLYAKHLGEIAEAKLEEQRAKQRLVSETRFNDFLKLGKKIRSIDRSKLFDAWYDYLVPENGVDPWETASKPLEDAPCCQAAFKILEIWRKYFGRYKQPPPELSNLLYDADIEGNALRQLLNEKSDGTLTTFKINRKFLPKGHWRMTSRDKAVLWLSQGLATQESEIEWERFDFLESLDPVARYEGEGGVFEQRYVVFDFERVAVAESSYKGNALYYVVKSKGDWDEIMTNSKREALEMGAERIIHGSNDNWKLKLRGLVRRGWPS